MTFRSFNDKIKTIVEKKIPSFFSSKVQLSRVIFIGLVLVLVFLSITFQHKKEINRLKYGERVSNTKIEELTKEIEELKISSARIVSHRPKLSAEEILYLKDRGLKNPVEDITADLMKHNELIPYQGIVGGKMGFYSKKDIYVVSTDLVRASFDDGHKKGWMLLGYQVAAEGEISWKVIESYLE